jgi:hypothetical protein
VVLIEALLSDPSSLSTVQQLVEIERAPHVLVVSRSVQHRADSTASWSKLGTVRTADSVGTGPAEGPAYRFRAENLNVGTHQFRLAYAPAGQSKKLQRTTAAVTATVEMNEAYRLSTYPNPVQQRVTVELAVQERQDMQVRLYDVLGRRVGTLHNGPLSAQELRRLRLDVSSTGLTSGTYFPRVSGEDFATTEQITVMR